MNTSQDILDREKLSNTRYMHLTVFIDSDDEKLKQLYKEKILEHNTKIINDTIYPDAGFDLFMPELDSVQLEKSHPKIDFQIQCSAEMWNVSASNNYKTGFYMYPRSSLSKTKLRLANSVGIIDAGYRGHLIGAFDCVSNSEGLTIPEPYSRLVQICAPTLVPIFVSLVSDASELGPSTVRGSGGFGSSGK